MLGLLTDSVIRASNALDYGIIFLKKDKVEFANTHIIELLGIPESKLIGMHPHDLIPEEEKRRLKELGHLDPKLPHDKYTTVLIDSEGRKIPVQMSCSLIEIGPFKSVGYFITDQSDLTQANRRIQESEERYSKFFKRSLVPMFSATPSGEIIEGNEALNELLETKDSTGVILPHKFKSKDAGEIFMDTLKTQKLLDNFEVEISTKEVEPRLVSINAVYYPEQQVIQGAILDISNRHKNEEKIRYLAVFDGLITRLSTHFIELPTEEIVEGIDFALAAIADFTHVDSAFILTFQNPTQMTLEFYVSNRSPQKTQQLKKVIDNNSFSALRGMLNKGSLLKVDDIEQVKSLSITEYNYLKNNGVKSFILMPMVRENDIIGTLGFAYFNKPHTWSDEMVTVLRVASEMFSNALFRKNVEEQVNQLYESQSKLFSQIAHSLKTPFTVALSNLELLRTAKDRNSRYLFIDSIKDSIQESSSIVGQLLKVAQMDLFPVGAKPDKFDSAELLEEIYSKGKALFRSHFNQVTNLEVERYFTLNKNQSATLTGDRRSLAEAILILIDNAFVHSPKPDSFPEVELSGIKTGNGLEIRVSDKGRGIAAEEIPKLFDLYYQGKNTGGGSGIGLAYCKKIIESQRGTVSVSSKLNQGTTVKIFLPRN